jgi:diacylglycerol kinase (ATP)
LKTAPVMAILHSLANAGNGIAHVLLTQRNARIHAAATAGVTAAGLLLDIAARDWCLLVLAMALVWMAEGFNTALEILADAVVPEHHPMIGRAKDVAAGAVLLAAIGAALVGALIFGPLLLLRLA